MMKKQRLRRNKQVYQNILSTFKTLGITEVETIGKEFKMCGIIALFLVDKSQAVNQEIYDGFTAL